MAERRFTAGEKLAAVERELGYRRRVYSRRVADRTMTQTLADEQIAVFEAIRSDYIALAEKERLL
jgi:hypothetical protein